MVSFCSYIILSVKIEWVLFFMEAEHCNERYNEL